MTSPTFPRLDQHVVLAGRTGTGKTTGAIDMLSRRLQIPWLIFDHKRDSGLRKLSLRTLAIDPLMLPREPGLYHIAPDRHGDIDRGKTEELLARVFKRGRFGVYIDEGHLMGFSPMIRRILVAGRDKLVPLMWNSQRAQSIDPFIWSQASFFRSYALQTPNDVKRFNENFPKRYTTPPRLHSHYWDGETGEQFLLAPARPIEASISHIDAVLGKVYNRV
jgi:hypothetical protein